MTIADTIADEHYRDRPALAHAFAASAQRRSARVGRRSASTSMQFDEPAFNVYMDDVKAWGIAALNRAARGAHLHDRGPYLLWLWHQGQYGLEGGARRSIGASMRKPSRRSREQDRPGIARMPQLERAYRTDGASQRQGRAGRLHRRRVDGWRRPKTWPRQSAPRSICAAGRSPCTNCGMAPMRRTSPTPSSPRSLAAPSLRARLYR